MTLKKPSFSAAVTGIVVALAHFGTATGCSSDSSQAGAPFEATGGMLNAEESGGSGGSDEVREGSGGSDEGGPMCHGSWCRDGTLTYGCPDRTPTKCEFGCYQAHSDAAYCNATDEGLGGHGGASQ
jgi:hypothetical protein